MLNKVHLSFPQLKKPNAYKPGDIPKYGADFIMPADHPGLAEVVAVVNRLAVDKWADKAPLMVAPLTADKRTCFYGDGNSKVKKGTTDIYTGYANMWYVGAKTASVPQLMSPVNPLDSNAKIYQNTMEYQQYAAGLYGGCIVNAFVRPYLQADGEGIRCELIAIQFAEDDTPFGEGVVDAQSYFGSVGQPVATPAPTVPVAPTLTVPVAPTVPVPPTAPTAPVAPTVPVPPTAPTVPTVPTAPVPPTILEEEVPF